MGVSGKLPAPIILCSTLISFVLLVSCTAVPVNHDAALLLQCAQLLLKGNIPYVDYVELNPPMANYLHTIPVLAANTTGITIAGAFQYSVVALVFASTLLLYLTLRASRFLESAAEQLLMLAGWIMFSAFIYASGSFGQREHLFALMLLPWLFVRAGRYSGFDIAATVSWTVGLLTAVMAMLKPHFLFILVLTEIWFCLRDRRVKPIIAPELTGLCIVVFLYGVHFLWIPTPMRVAFFSRWMPYIFHHYHVYNNAWQRVLFVDSIARALIPATAGVLLIAVFVVKRRLGSVQNILVEGLIAAAAAAFISYAVQQKAWLYHTIPFLGIMGVLAVVVAVSLFRGKTLLYYAFAGLTVLSLVFIERRVLKEASDMDQQITPLVSFMQRSTASGDRVVFISTNVYPSYPALLYANRLPGTRYLVAFPIALFYDGQPAGEGIYHKSAPPEEKRFLQELGNDITGRKPALVFIDTTDCQGCPPGFRVDQYLGYTGWKEEYLQQYEELPALDQFAVYRRRVEEIRDFAAFR